MTSRLTLIADAHTVAGRGRPLPAGLGVRAMSPADAEALAHLYLDAYFPSEGAMSLDEAREEMRATFAGDFGELWLEASPVVVDAADSPLAAVMTVADAPPAWATPAGPFVIEVFTASPWRGRGLAGALLASAAGAVVASGGTTLALRVDHDNVGAMRLYCAMGFAGAALPTLRELPPRLRAGWGTLMGTSGASPAQVPVSVEE